MSTVTDRIKELEARRAAIVSDQRLSQVGRQQKLDELNAEAAGYMSQAIHTLKADAEQVLSQARKADQNVRDAINKASLRWNFERLNFLGERAKAEFQMARDLNDTKAVYERIRDIGDDHAQKAAAAVGKSIIFTRFGDQASARDLMRQMSADYDKLEYDADVEAAKEKTAAHAKAIIDMDETIKAVSRFYPGNDAQFRAIMAGVTITRKMTPEDPDHFEKVSVTFN